MKRPFVLLVALTGFFAGSQTQLCAAEPDEELRLIQVLQSTTAGPGEKDAACARLKFIGTALCVPALATLLTDDQLSHSARYALEPMQLPEASRALLDALGKTKSELRVGIINSLGVREEKDAVTALVQLLRDPENETAEASARALGQIGGTEAVTALRASARNPGTALHEAAVDALLRCANRMLVSGQRSGALAIFEQLDVPKEKDSVRVAAFRGRVAATGNAGLNMVLNAISGPPGPSQVASLQLARGLQIPHATRELARLLPNLKQPVLNALIGVLGQRGDVTAVPELKKFAATASAETRVPIIQAMDLLGDASVVPLLANWGAAGSPEVQKASRQALADLHHGDVTQALIDQFSGTSPPVQAELARALGARGDKAAVPKLIDLAQRGPDSARKGALQALSVLVDGQQVSSLVDLVLRAKDPAGRNEAAEAANSAYQRFQTQHSRADVTALVDGIEKSSNDARTALLPICSGLVDPKVREALRGALHEKDAQVQTAAVRALCDTTDAELLPDLLELARPPREDSVRTLAISGGVRLITQEDTVKLTPQQRVAALKSLLACATGPDQKRRVLAGLGEVPDVETLQVVETTLDDPSVRNEAARAAVKVAAALPASQALACESALKKALATADEDGTRRAVQAALNQIEDNSDYLTNWEVAGPYEQKDKDYAALFDIPFPPESKDSQGVKWQPLPAGADPKRPWVMDLLKALGGEQRVAYARTSVHSDRQQGAILELGSDDGVKIWLNDKQVYALNVARPLQPASDKVNVTLHAGWNPLLLKITQNAQGWEFCVRIRNPDGSRIGGVRCDAAPLSAAK
jgi:HEAT repeat protein